MKFLKKLFISLITFFLITLAFGFLYINFYGKTALLNTVSSALNKEVTLSSLVYQFPFGVKAKNVSIGESIKVPAIKASLNVTSLWSPQTILSQVMLINPVFDISRKTSEAKAEGEASQSIPTQNGRNSKKRSTLINQFFVYGGSLKHTNAEGRVFILRDIDLEARSLKMPLDSVRLPFEISARLDEKEAMFGYIIKGRGWIDWAKKDMVGAFESYSAEGERIYTANANSENNDLKVIGTVQSTALSKFLKQKSKEPEYSASFGEAFTIGLLSLNEYDVEYSFSTKLDKFKVEKIDFSGSAVTE